MRTRYRLFLALGLSALLFLLVAAGCSSSGLERVWLKAPDWRRAQRVGHTQLNDPVPVVVDESGTIYLLKVSRDNGASRPTVVALDRRLEPLWERPMPVALVQPDVPQLVWDGRRLHLFWLDRNSLYTAAVDPAGTIVGDPRLLSAEHTVDSFAAIAGPEGDLVLWYGGSRRDPGLFQVELADDQAEPLLLDPAGVRPALAFDGDGKLHAAWAHYPTGFEQPRFFYAAYETGRHRPGQEIVVAELLISPTSVMLGPYLGLDQEQAYLFWTISVRTGNQAGTADSRFVVITPGDPATVSEALPLSSPVEHDLNYEPWSDGSLRAGRRVALSSALRGNSSLVDMFMNPVKGSELAAIYASQLTYLWNKSATQVSIMYFSDGRPGSYQLLSFSSTVSSSPAVFNDADGYLYATWLESAESGFAIHLSSTAPDIQETLAAITAYDIRRLTGETLFGLVSGVVLAPFAGLLWLVVPLLVLVLTSFLRRGEQQVTSAGTLISLALAVAVYEAIKFGTLPGILDYAPFSAWLPMPDWMRAVLRVLVPAATTFISLWLAWNFTYRRQHPAPLYFMLIFGAAEGVMTMAIYGVLIYGAL
jgi:hypothetical protein